MSNVFDPRADAIATVASTLVSVIIPCRNAARWLPETLQSVLTQSGVTLEVVVVDDGSDDGSGEVADLDPRIRVIRQPALGVSAARNAGTTAARGGFLQYLDADDLLVPGTLAARMAMLRETEADVALTRWVRWEPAADGTFREGEIRGEPLGQRPDVDLLTDAWWPPGAVLYRRTMVDRIGPWRTDLPIIQDARFLLDAALHGARFCHVTEVGLKYRVLPGSLSRRDPSAFLGDCYRSAAELHDRWFAQGTLDDDRRRALVKVYAHVARPFYQTDRARFGEVFGRITRLTPQFLPEGPASLRALSTVVGYPAAEQVALWWRHLKNAAGLAT
ncbi:MAG: glycosyltransferase [Vicinamibacterales bacterium]